MENINKDNKEEKEDKNIEENKEAICIICQRKFASFEKLKIKYVGKYNLIFNN